MNTSNFHYRPYFLKSLAISLIGTSILGMVFFLIDNGGFFVVKLLISGIIWSVYSATGTCAASLYDRKYANHWFHDLAIIGMVTSMVGCLITLIAVWDLFASVNIWHAAGICLVLSVMLSILCLLMPLHRPAMHHSLGLRIIISITLIASILCGLLIISYLLGLFIRAETVHLRLIGATLIPSVLGTIGIPVLVHMRYVSRNLETQN